MKPNYKAKAKEIINLVKAYGHSETLPEIIQNELEIAHSNGMIEALKKAKETIWEK